NVARLGKKVALAACLGTDGFGHFLLSELHSKEVDTRFILQTPLAPTTISIISRSRKTPDFLIHRGADSHLVMTKDLSESIEQCDVIHTSAFALSRDPARSTILELLAKANQAEKLITFDPNYHPEIWPDTPDFIELLKPAFAYATITKPSIEDCHRLLGAGKHPQEYCEMFKSWGAKIVIITMGREGVFLADQEDNCYLIHPNQIKVTDVTGAGDAFWSGVITGILNGCSVLDSARAGQVIAEIKLKHLGPIKEMPDWDQITESSKSIRYQRC
ncbi:MAG: carbohydrate kinase family protein, partial [Anaerolineales bacterium]